MYLFKSKKRFCPQFITKGNDFQDLSFFKEKVERTEGKI